jgi:hypothetical protein
VNCNQLDNLERFTFSKNLQLCSSKEKFSKIRRTKKTKRSHSFCPQQADFEEQRGVRTSFKGRVLQQEAE